MQNTNIPMLHNLETPLLQNPYKLLLYNPDTGWLNTQDKLLLYNPNQTDQKTKRQTRESPKVQTLRNTQRWKGAEKICLSVTSQSLLN